MVLNQNNENEKHQKLLIDQIIANSISQSTNSDEISCVIKAFMQLDLSNELIQLLEKIIFNNGNLQILLIFTAIKIGPTKIMNYINNLNNFDGISITKVCDQNNYKLFKEAFVIYKKFKNNIEAINITNQLMLKNLN